MSLKSEWWAKKIYLLREDVKGEVKSKKFKLFSINSQTWEASKGVFLEENSDDEQPSDREKLFLRSIDNPQNTVTVHISQVYKLSDEYYFLMMAVPDGFNRVEILREPGKLRQGKTVQPGDLVNIETKHGVFEARIRYKGPISGENGTFFGVEFERKVGDCDGKPHFECEDQYGSYVALHDIHFINKHEKTQLSNNKTSNEDNRTQFTPTSRYNGMKIGTKVLCFIPGYQESLRGFVVYIGTKESNIDPVAVGVQLFEKPSKPIENGNFYKDYKLFECPEGLGYITTDMNSLHIVEENESNILDKSFKTNSRDVFIIMAERLSTAWKTFGKLLYINDKYLNFLNLQQIPSEEKMFTILNEWAKSNPDKGWSHLRNLLLLRNEEEVVKTCEIKLNDLKQNSSLQINDMVEFQMSGTTFYGVLKWRGFVSGVVNEVAGIELEESTSHLTTTDGVFMNERYFVCLSSRGYFTNLSKCKPDNRFQNFDKPTS